MAIVWGRVAVAVTKSVKIVKKIPQPVTGKHDKLNMLLGAVMALPGLAQATDAGVRDDEVKIDYNHAYYSESDDRMQVDVDQLAVTVPIAGDFELKFNTIRDATSGASPVLYLANPGDAPIQVLQAGASIKDVRNVYDISAGYYGDNNYVSAKIGTSEEDDYKADFISANYVQYLNGKNTSLIFSYAQSSDSVWNVYFAPGSAEFDPFLDPKAVKERDQQDFQFAIDQVLDTNSHIELAISAVTDDGDLSDPYKRVYVQGSGISTPDLYQTAGGTPEKLEAFIRTNYGAIDETVRNALGIFNDARPDSRKQWIYLIRYSRYLSFADAAMHIDYRRSDDDWGAKSETIEAKWSQALPWGIILTPGIRYYSQDNADFYNIVFPTFVGFANTDHSSDYRLAGFGAISYKLAIDKTFMDSLSVRFSYEQYQRDFDLAWDGKSKGDAVDDYSYQLVSLSVGYLFK